MKEKIIIGLGVISVVTVLMLSQFYSVEEEVATVNKFIVKTDMDKIMPAEIVVQKSNDVSKEVDDNTEAFKNEISKNYVSLVKYYNFNTQEYFDIRDTNRYIKTTNVVGYDTDAYRAEFLINKDNNCLAYLESVQDFKSISDLSISYQENGFSTILVEVASLNKDLINKICKGSDIKLIVDLTVKL